MMSSVLRDYRRQVEADWQSGDATEHTHRPTLKRLLEQLCPDVTVINEPKRIACGAPDLAVQRVMGTVRATIGYIETKDIGTSLDEAERSEQLQRYRQALPNLILTNYLEFRWYVKGELQRLARIERDADTVNLLHDFLQYAPEPIGDADTLAMQMARYAHLIRDTLMAAFQKGQESPLLHDLRKAFAKTLLPNLDQPKHLPDFADMLAQTLAYGLFAARCYHPAGQPFQRVGAAHEIPRTNPFLRQLFETLTSTAIDEEPFVGFLDDLVYLLHNADMERILQEFGKRTGREDPVVHFYETFLKAYDPQLRELRGVYYTPEPVVGYLVRSVHRLLQQEFGLREGLATLHTTTYTPPPGTAPTLYLLDPACGTGSFLAHIIQFIRDELHCKGLGGLWNEETLTDLMERLYGFELLMAPYTIAHLKLGLLLTVNGGVPKTRLGVYLTNTLELPGEQIPMEPGPLRILSEEALAASRIKRETPILVIIGNPPYSVHSANKIEWIENLIRNDYYPRDQFKERNPKMLLDDYVKFIRWAQWRLERTGQGILAFITNHSYLDSPTFRGMRHALMKAFDKLYLLDLHGDKRRKEVAPDGGKDENVFDIQQGVAILLAVKLPKPPNPPSGSPSEKGDQEGIKARVFHHDLWGEREAKYAFLNEQDVATTPWRELHPQPPFYLFVPQDTALLREYEQGWKITDIFRLHSTGVKTHRDHFAIDFERDKLEKRIQAFRDLNLPDETIRQQYHLRDTRDWKLSANRQALANDPDWHAYFQQCLYRPFDVRWIYYTPRVIELPREEVMRHMLKENIALITTRQQSQSGEWALVGISDKIVECCTISNKTREVNYVFPLYLYYKEQDAHGKEHLRRESNLNPKFVKALQARIGGEVTPDQILAYLYAVLHAPSYRTRYAPFLRRDFPRIPLPGDREQFERLVMLGQELIDYHLLRHAALQRSSVGFPIRGDNRVEKGYPHYDQPVADMHRGRVWINDKQYFEGISPAVWAFQVGSYQVCKKWLADRRGRALTNAEILTYRQIVDALGETLRLMAEIEQVLALKGASP